jgi:ATP-binding cassette subfamily B protein
MFPRYLLESIGLIIITIIAYLISHNNIEPSLEITILGTFALGAQRLLPAFQQIYSSWAGMGAQIYSARNVLDLLDQNAETEEDNFKNFEFNKSFEIKCEAVSFQYKKTVKETLSNINFSIKPGERIGIIGKTGGGKSTLLDLIMGLLKPSSGRLLVNNIDVNLKYNKNFLKSYQSQISHVPQNIFLSDSSIIENIAFGVPNSEIIMTKVKKAAREAMADEFIENLPEGYNTKVGERGIRLSGGQRQRIAIARALYKDSRIIFFDEATSALDEKTERDLINSIYSLKKDITLVMISHRLSTLSYCEKIVEIKNKKIYLKTNN